MKVQDPLPRKMHKAQIVCAEFNPTYRPQSFPEWSYPLGPAMWRAGGVIIIYSSITGREKNQCLILDEAQEEIWK
jgi:hypothetical protein